MPGAACLRLSVIAGAVVFALGLVGAVVAPRVVAEPVVEPAAEKSSGSARPTTPTVGFSINLHHTGQIELYLDAIDRMAAMGCDSVQVRTPMFQRHGAAETIAILDDGPGRSPRRADLVRLLRHARDRGLHTAMMPNVLFTEPRGNEWRGRIQPHDWDRWWASYRACMDYFVDIAVEADVSMLAVGSELVSTESQTERWTTLIANIRARYDGELYYSTVFNSYTRPTFWAQVDVLGVSGYWDLTQGTATDQPGDAQLAARWAAIRRDLLDYAATQRRPVLLTEIGYPSLPWALRQPWNYIHKGAAADHATQARGIASAIAAWRNLLEPDADPTVLRGMYLEKWDPYHAGGPTDRGYGLRGKPAMQHVTEWLNDRRRQ